jgi:hypothetical protein
LLPIRTLIFVLLLLPLDHPTTQSPRRGGPGEPPPRPAGIATFNDVSPGALQVNAYAEGFDAASVRVAEEARATIIIALTRR